MALLCHTESRVWGLGRGPHGQRSITESPSWIVAEALRVLKCKVPEILLGALLGDWGHSCLHADALCPALHRHRARGPLGPPAGAGLGLSVCPLAGPRRPVPQLDLGVCHLLTLACPLADSQGLSPGCLGERALPLLRGLHIFYRKAERCESLGVLEKEPEERKEGGATREGTEAESEQAGALG